MSSSIWGYLFLILGIMAAALLILFGNINTKNEQNYYLLKEVTQNAMLDSVDKDAYEFGLQDEELKIDTVDCVAGKPGTIRIVTEKFLENFTRRYASLANENYDYKIEVFDIQECPAKVSLKVTATENFSWQQRLFRGKSDNSETIIVNDLSAILETKD